MGEFMDYSKVINNVFLNKNEIRYPAELKGREFAIIYPTDGYYLSEEQYLVIKRVLLEENLIDDVMNIDIEFLGEDPDTNMLEIREMHDFNYSMYKDMMLLFENSILDSNFRWSISIYQDYWGVIYGPSKMIYKISENFDLKKDLRLFREEVLDDIRDEQIKSDFERFIRRSYNYKKI